MVIYKIKKKQIPQNINFRCGMTPLIYSLLKLGKTFKLPKELLKTERNRDEIDENIWREKKMNGCLMLKMTFSVLLTHTPHIINVWKK